jgi:hypothetical protein
VKKKPKCVKKEDESVFDPSGENKNLCCIMLPKQSLEGIHDFFLN